MNLALSDSLNYQSWKLTFNVYKESELQEWYHGTNVYFDNWSLSETTSVYKRELVPHSFISFSIDDELLKGAGEGRCKIQINEDARIANLLEDSFFSKELWKKVSSHPFGAMHIASGSLSEWERFCFTGQILRPYFIVNERLSQWGRKLNSLPDKTILDEFFKDMVQQNFVRHWIEFFMRTVRSMGVDGVICNEYTNYSNKGPRTSLNLYIFDVGKITPPVWLQIPDSQKANNERDFYERDDIKRVIKKMYEYPYPFSY